LIGSLGFNRKLKKIAHKRTEKRWPAHSFETLLADLGTICVNTIEPTDRSIPPFKKVTLRLAHRELRDSTKPQGRALHSLGNMRPVLAAHRKLRSC